MGNQKVEGTILVLFTISMGIGVIGWGSPRAPTVVPYTTLEANLMLLWGFYEGSGTIIHDISGNPTVNNGATTGSPSWVSGQDGQALSFTGTGTTGDNVATSNTITITWSSSYTLLARFYEGTATFAGSNFHEMIFGDSSFNFGISTSGTTGNVFKVWCKGTALSITASLVTFNTWHTIAATYANSVRTLYVDNQKISTDSTGTCTGSNAYTLKGGTVGATTQEIPLAISEIAMYNASLTQTQMSRFWQMKSYTIPRDGLSAQKSAQTGTLASLLNYTGASLNYVYQIGGDIDVTAFTSGVISLQVTYTDWNSGSQTITIDSASVLGDNPGNSETILVKASTIIVFKTTGTFVATYNVGCWIMPMS